MKLMIVALMIFGTFTVYGAQPVVAIADCRIELRDGLVAHRNIAVKVQTNDHISELNYICASQITKSVGDEYSRSTIGATFELSHVITLDKEEKNILSNFLTNSSKKSSQLTLKAKSLVK